MRFALSIVLTIGCALLPAMAEERSHAIVSDQNLEVVFAPSSEKSVGQTSIGEIYAPDTVFVKTIDPKSFVDLPAAVLKYYDIVLADFQISVRPADQEVINTLRLAGTIGFASSFEKKSQIVDLLPSTKFTAGSIGADGSLSINGKGEFAAPVPGASLSAGVAGSLTVKFEYKPYFASTVSGFGGNAYFVSFTKTNESQPVGTIPIRVTYMKPKESPKTFFDINVEIDASSALFTRRGKAFFRVALE